MELHAGGGGDDSDIFAGVRDGRSRSAEQERPRPRLADGGIGSRWADRHRDDLCGWPHLRCAHEPRRHSRLRRVPPFPLDSGLFNFQIQSMHATFVRKINKCYVQILL